MTPSPSTAPSPAAAPAEEGEDVLRLLTERMVRFVRLTSVVRSRSGTSPGQERDRAAYLVLLALERLGPVRQRTLAEELHADPSTLSRQVGFLVNNGLLHRTADAHDGRACLLEVTSAGAALTDGLRRRREHHIAGVLADWTPAERASFSQLFGRFVDGLAALVDGRPAADPPSLPHDGRPPSTDAESVSARI